MKNKLDKLEKITTKDILEHYEYLLHISLLNKFNTFNNNHLRTKEEVKKFLDVEWKLAKDNLNEMEKGE